MHLIWSDLLSPANNNNTIITNLSYSNQRINKSSAVKLSFLCSVELIWWWKYCRFELIESKTLGFSWFSLKNNVKLEQIKMVFRKKNNNKWCFVGIPPTFFWNANCSNLPFLYCKILKHWSLFIHSIAVPPIRSLLGYFFLAL